MTDSPATPPSPPGRPGADGRVASGPPPVDGGEALAADPVGPATAGPDAVGSPPGTADDAPSGAPPLRPTRADRHRGRRRRRRAPGRKAPWWELPVLVVVAVAVAVLVKTFLIQPFYIPSASMERTLHGCPGCSGDRVVVNKPVYDLVRDPAPGDVVVFRAPPGWDDGVAAPDGASNPLSGAVRWFGRLVGVVPPAEEDLIKRVVAVGGQTVKCCDAAGNVQVSDSGPAGPFRSLDDASYVYEDPGSARYGQLRFGPLTVPRGRLWVMGDHRNDSKDSRYYCGTVPSAATVSCDDGTVQTATAATVPVDLVIGKAVVIAWPPSRWTTLGTPPTFEAGRAAAARPAGPAGLPLPLLVAGAPLAVGGVAATGGYGLLRRTRTGDRTGDRPRPARLRRGRTGERARRRG